MSMSILPVKYKVMMASNKWTDGLFYTTLTINCNSGTIFKHLIKWRITDLFLIVKEQILSSFKSLLTYLLIP